MLKHPIGGPLLWAAVVSSLVAFCLSDLFAQQPNPAQDQVERTIGSLVVGNATCNAQNAALVGELDKARKELAELKAKQEPKK